MNFIESPVTVLNLQVYWPFCPPHFIHMCLICMDPCNKTGTPTRWYLHYSALCLPVWSPDECLLSNHKPPPAPLKPQQNRNKLVCVSWDGRQPLTGFSFVWSCCHDAGRGWPLSMWGERTGGIRAGDLYDLTPLPTPPFGIPKECTWHLKIIIIILHWTTKIDSHS